MDTAKPMAPSVEKQLLTALTQLAETARAVPAAGARIDFLPLFKRIDELAGQLPRNADPALLHYLRQKSYEKARLFLSGRDAENQNGGCLR